MKPYHAITKMMFIEDIKFELEKSELPHEESLLTETEETNTNVLGKTLTHLEATEHIEELENYLLINDPEILETLYQFKRALTKENSQCLFMLFVKLIKVILCGVPFWPPSKNGLYRKKI
ncbi:hypothetical protein NGRA_2632 [Nosema granulosis]|uniref:Uncharacterized protein n=1 Tax=Nosema granulosis TaxID=83296 RepID=A0A9P6GWR4_9MICR|nr:hypothetical protein NGRA_2632 [Nosema granulosis]